MRTKHHPGALHAVAPQGGDDHGKKHIPRWFLSAAVTLSLTLIPVHTDAQTQPPPGMPVDIQEPAAFEGGATWTWDGNGYIAHWKNGAIARMKVANGNFTPGSTITIDRIDTLNSSTAGLTAVYTGTVSPQGNSVHGSVTWTWRGFPRGHAGPAAWTATWETRPQPGDASINISDQQWYESDAVGERYNQKGERQYHAFSPVRQSGDTRRRYYDLFIFKGISGIFVDEADCARIRYRTTLRGILQSMSDRVQFETDETDWTDVEPGSIEFETIKKVCGQAPLKSPVVDPLKEGRGWVFSPGAAAEEREHQRWASLTLAERREELIEHILTDTPANVANLRRVCVMGREPELVRDSRNSGDNDEPDAIENCNAALRREEHDGRLMELYERITREVGGSAKPEDLLKAIGTAALAGKPTAQVGGQEINLTPPLILDAGYSKGTLERATLSSLGVADTQDNRDKFRAIAQGCLDGQNKNAPALSTCFVAGLALAAKDNSSKGVK